MTPLDLNRALPIDAAPDAETVAPAAGTVLHPPVDADAEYRTKATAAAEKFESFFIGQMLKQMRSSASELADEDSVFKDPTNSDMLGLADNLMADKMAGQHAFGIADAILRQLLPATPQPAATISAATEAPPFNAAAAAVASDKRGKSGDDPASDPANPSNPRLTGSTP